jgi:uncharacterized membrane protein YccC
LQPALYEESGMHMKPRRIGAAVLVVFGGLMMLFAPETIGGAVLVGVGVIVEIAGITLERRPPE